MLRFIAFGLITTTCLTGIAADVPDATRQKLASRAEALQQQIETLRADGHSPETLADVAVCGKAADWILRHDEFFKPDYAEKTSRVLDLGEARATALRAGQTDWANKPGGVALAYISEVDGSVQPYALSLPESFDPNDSQQWPLYVVLHGRNGTLTEASFIAGIEGKKPASGDYIRLDVYGRGNNAFRWAGETDVFEAIADVQRRFRIDHRRIVLWGFSMGGAGAWHLGLHHPDRWAAVGAGAGFVDLYGYTNRKEKLPPHQHAALSIYDSVNYAMNAANVPFVTYGGDQDKQLLASTTMVEAAEPLGVEIEFIVGKNIGHKFTPEAEQEFQAFLAGHAKTGRPLPFDRKSIRFTTHTTKYNHCGWVTIAELTEPYAAAVVEAEISDDGSTAVVTTSNVAAILLGREVANDVELDGVRLPLRDAGDGLLPDVYYLRSGEEWRLLSYGESRAFQSNPDLRKRHGLQGPIDDAFMSSFVVVKGDGTPWSEHHQKYADWSFARFEKEWDKWMRGALPVVEANELSEETLASSHLVLFGDPGSNPLIAKVLPDLPIEWTQESLKVAGTTYDPEAHAAVLIFPNPLNPRKYVVLNTGHTFHTDAFKGTNALLYPRLGDIAVLKLSDDGKGGFKEETAWAGLFDTNWELGESARE